MRTLLKDIQDMQAYFKIMPEGVYYRGLKRGTVSTRDTEIRRHYGNGEDYTPEAYYDVSLKRAMPLVVPPGIRRRNA